MANRRFASWPEFNGRKVVLDDDKRLNSSGAPPTTVPPGTSWEIGENMQAVAFVRIQLDGTLIVDGTLVML